MPGLKELEKLLLTHQQMDDKYDELNRRGKIHPYIYKLGSKQQWLYFFGVRHTYDPEDEQHAELKTTWGEWLTETEGGKRIVLTEGGKRPVSKGEIDAIKENGEAGLATYLADKANVRVESPEPDRREEADMLAEKFGRDRVMFYYFIRQVPQWFSENQQRGVEFEEYFGNFMKLRKKSLGWENYDFSITHMKELFKEYTGVAFKVPKGRQGRSDVYEQHSPTHNEVASACSRYRDKYILSYVKELWDEGYSIFIVYGSGHAIVMEPALRALVNNK